MPPQRAGCEEQSVSRAPWWHNRFQAQAPSALRAQTRGIRTAPEPPRLGPEGGTRRLPVREVLERGRTGARERRGRARSRPDSTLRRPAPSRLRSRRPCPSARPARGCRARRTSGSRATVSLLEGRGRCRRARPPVHLRARRRELSREQQTEHRRQERYEHRFRSGNGAQGPRQPRRPDNDFGARHGTAICSAGASSRACSCCDGFPRCPRGHAAPAPVRR